MKGDYYFGNTRRGATETYQKDVGRTTAVYC